jgi:WD40 repeat protein
LKHEGGVMSAQFSPDGKRVLTASWGDQAARLWDTATGELSGEPMRHKGNLMAAQFSPDGQRL